MTSMGDMLTQEEINALLAGGDDDSSPDMQQSLGLDLDADLASLMEDSAGEMPALDSVAEPLAGSVSELGADDFEPSAVRETLTDEQKDALGEIGNISMGTAATTLFTLLNSNKVLITTPVVTTKTWKTLSQGYDRPCVGITVNYTEGLTGSNVLIMKEHDVKVIADIMMGGVGDVPEEERVTDMDLSAIGEAMNQMVGSASTSLSSVINRKIDIDTPQAVVLNFGEDDFFERNGFVEDDELACVAFRMEIGDLIDSELIQIIPIDFARDMVNKMMNDLMGGIGSEAEVAEAVAAPPVQPMAAPPVQSVAAPPPAMAPNPGMYQQPVAAAYPPPSQAFVNPSVAAQQVTFQPLDMNELAQQKENIGIIMDVPLEITVELGRTSRKIREILEFAPGTIVDLDKLAGEPIDILVNGKFVASGEVVVVDENFAVRVTDILSVDKRI
jgi:flagellar motor switch protein FliN/FliY